jgi:hypothetical protein
MHHICNGKREKESVLDHPVAFFHVYGSRWSIYFVYFLGLGQPRGPSWTGSCEDRKNAISACTQLCVHHASQRSVPSLDAQRIWRKPRRLPPVTYLVSPKRMVGSRLLDVSYIIRTCSVDPFIPHSLAPHPSLLIALVPPLTLTLLSTTPRVNQYPGLHVLLVHPTALIISPTHRLLPQASLPPHPAH